MVIFLYRLVLRIVVREALRKTPHTAKVTLCLGRSPFLLNTAYVKVPS